MSDAVTPEGMTQSHSNTTTAAVLRGGTPPLFPDFTVLALEQLQLECDAFREHTRAYLEQASMGRLKSLIDDVTRCRDTLVLLGRPGAVMVSNELLALLDAVVRGQVENAEESAHALVLCSEQLSDYVAYLKADDALDSVLPLLPALNNCRACRGVELLSESLVQAAGIPWPPQQHQAAPGDVDLAAFVQHVRGSRAPLMRSLLDWYRDSDRLNDALGDVAALFSRLSESCTPQTQLQLLAPVFQSAEIISTAIHAGQLDNSAALKRLFAQLERLLLRCSRLSMQDAESLDQILPDALCRNLLYYVGLSGATSDKAQALRRRFRLDQLVPNRHDELRARGALTGVNESLVQSIRDSIDLETEALRQWLAQAASDQRHPDAARLRSRLQQLDPVLTMLGAHRALDYLRLINTTLADMAENPERNSAGERLQLAESLIRLDRSLDLAGRRSADSTLPVSADQPLLNLGTPEPLLQEATVACLGEARRRLASLEQKLGLTDIDDSALLPRPGDRRAREQAVQQIRQIQTALQVLPLTEPAPLFDGLSEVLASHDTLVWTDSIRDSFATAWVSLDFYLGSAASAPRAAQPLLASGLAAINDLLAPDSQPAVTPGGNAPSITAESTQPTPRTTDSNELTVPLTGAPESMAEDELIDESLLQMSSLSEQLARLRQIDSSSEPNAVRVCLARLLESSERLRAVGQAGKARDIESLGQAAHDLLSHLNHAATETNAESAPRVPRESLDCLDETVAILPQLIDQLQGNSDQVQGLDDLLKSLQQLASVDADLPGSIGHSPSHSVAVAEAASDSEQASAPAVGLSPDAEQWVSADDTVPLHDNTLHEVFFGECDQHIATLTQAIDVALHDAAEALPNESMLRALHTLAGSAQTVDADAIVAIVQPLQRACLARQRDNRPFDASDLPFLADLVEALSQRLSAMRFGNPVAPEVVETERALPAFVDRLTERKESLSGLSNWSVPRIPEEANPTLQDVFDGEARSLLAAMRQQHTGLVELLPTTHRDAVAIEPESPETQSAADALLDGLLSHLHTLKGSARMAGHAALAERAHELESDLQQRWPLLRSTLTQGLGDLQAMLARTDTQTSKAETQAADPAPSAELSDSGQHEPGSVSPPPVGLDIETPRVGANAQSGSGLSITEATFERLLAQATDASVSQARMGNDLARLRDAFKDLDATVERLQRLSPDYLPVDAVAAHETLADLETARRALGEALHDADSEQLHGSRAGSALQQSLIRAQLVRMSDSTDSLRAVMRDAAAQYDRQVQLHIDGGDTTLDRALFRRVLGPLEHLVRNAVVHGIEPVSDRLAAGKPAMGNIRLRADIDGTDLLLSVTDDGAGVDRTEVDHQRARRGVGPVDSMESLRDALCESGFSTAEEVTQLAGRGMGLASVVQSVSAAGGQLNLNTRIGQGTQITLRLPQQILVNQVVLVEINGALHAIPVNFVHTVQPDSAATGDHVQQRLVEFQGCAYRQLSLAILMGSVADSRNGELADKTQSRVLVGAGSTRVALLVDSILGYRELIAQPLGAQLNSLHRYIGGSVLPDGRQVLILDLNRLLSQDLRQLSREQRALQSEAALDTVPPTALIADDSITMRVAAEQMLEARGIQPIMARDGAEALSMLKQQLPDVLLIDIDMPKLSGFDVLRRLSESHPDHSLPIIMISTRDTRTDRDQAEALGVRQFLAKPYRETQLHNALLDVGIPVHLDDSTT